MNREEQQDDRAYEVVLNHEEQYSIWPADRPIPLGWRTCGKRGPKRECLAYIGQVWTDMRPLSLRKKMAEAEQSHEPPSSGPTPANHNQSRMDELVQYLVEGEHPVIASLRPKPSVAYFKECIDRDYVHIRFTDTQGGTELGVRLCSDATDLTHCDFQHGSGWVHLAGNLILNDVRVKCVADIDLETFAGTGHLELIDES